MRKEIEKYYELETKPVLGATGGASLGSVFGSMGILVGGILGFLIAIGFVWYFFFYKKD